MGFMTMVAVMSMAMLVLPIFIVTALAVGAVALANMLFFLPYDDPVSRNSHVKPASTLENDLLFIKAIKYHGRFKGVHN